MSAEFPILAEIITATLTQCGIDNADMVETPGIVRAWREACTIRTVEQLTALPPESIVKTEGGTVACRHYDRIHGVVFGDDRPFEWPKHLASELPALLIWHPDWSAK